VVEEASTAPGFVGAYFAGSASWLPDHADLPATSDLDVNLVFAGPDLPASRGKLLYRGLLLDVTPRSLSQLGSPEQILSHYHLAGGFRTPSIILDPTGQLAELQAAVSRDFPKRPWVRVRCEHARRRVLEGLAALDGSAPLPDQVIGWLFPTGVTTHVLLTAGLRNPTVRKRYAAVRDLLADYGHLAFHETLLALLGSARVSQERAEQHLAALTEVFDAAAAVARTPFSFSSDISAIARPLAIDGSKELIRCGLHRETMFWIAVTLSRCQKVLAADAPELKQRFEPGYRDLLSDLGIRSFADIQERREQVKAHLPRIWEVAEAIMAANPEIEV
jgi:hypothetical protein